MYIFHHIDGGEHPSTRMCLTILSKKQKVTCYSKKSETDSFTSSSNAWKSNKVVVYKGSFLKLCCFLEHHFIDYAKFQQKNSINLIRKEPAN